MFKKTAFISALLLAGCAEFYDYPELAPDIDEPMLPPVAAQASVNMQDMYLVKAYETAAGRAAAKMIDDTVDIYDTAPETKIYIKQIVKNSPNLPDGFHTARRTLKQITGAAGTYTVVSTPEEADYLLEGSVNEVQTGTGQPTILFRLSLNDKSNQPLRAWNVVITQMLEDQSWW